MKTDGDDIEKAIASDTCKKKGLKKGRTYSVKVKVTDKGNSNYKAKSKNVTLKIKVGEIM